METTQQDEMVAELKKPDLDPYYSCLVGGFEDGSSPQFRIGFGWEHLAKRLCMLRFKLAYPFMLCIDNVTELDRPDASRMNQPGNEQIFQLVPGEYIAAVVAKVYCNHIRGVRIRTNMRSTLWYGSSEGSDATFVAPTGYFINAICTTGDGNTYGDVICQQLGVLYVPFTDLPLLSESKPEGTLIVSEKVLGSTGADSFANFTNQPRVVIVAKRGHVIHGLHVVSNEMYNRCIKVQDSITRTDEHWEVLADNERIQSVSINIQFASVCSLQLKTNFRTVPWIGQTPRSESMTLDCSDISDSYICGFHGTKNDRGQVVSLGVVYVRLDKKE